MKRYSYWIFLLFLFACSTGSQRLPYEAGNEVFGLAGPVKLQKDTSSLYMGICRTGKSYG